MGNPRTSKMVDWKIQTHFTSVKTIQYDVIGARSLGLFLHKWGGLNFQSNIFETFGSKFYYGRAINRPVKLSAQQVCTIFISSQIVFMFIWETSNIVGKPGIVCPVFFLIRSKNLQFFDIHIVRIVSSVSARKLKCPSSAQLEPENSGLNSSLDGSRS